MIAMSCGFFIAVWPISTTCMRSDCVVELLPVRDQLLVVGEEVVVADVVAPLLLWACVTLASTAAPARVGGAARGSARLANGTSRQADDRQGYGRQNVTLQLFALLLLLRRRLQR